MTTYWQHSGVKDMAYATPGLVASNISWQRIETLDFGIDFSLFNQVNVTFDWFRRKTKDMIVGMEGLSYNIGSTAPQGNYGQLHTDGWEISLNYGHVFDNGFSLSATATLADAVTTIDEYGTAKTVTGWYNGKTYGEIWGYQVDRIFQNDDFARDGSGNLIKTTDKYGSVYEYASGKNYATQGKVTSGSLISGPGDFKYKDLNGDGVIDNGAQLIDDHGDLTVIGNTTPRYEYSFRADMAWKGFDLSIFFQGIGKRDMWGSSALTLPGFNTSDGAMAAAFANDFWYETIENGTVVDSNYGARYPRAANTSNGSAILNTVTNDNLLLNMAYLRLKNVTFGYTIPAKITKKAFIQKFRAYISLENFLTFDHLNGLPIDVEEISGYSILNESNYNSSRAGVGAPAFKTASFGLQLTF
jgi:TonB dependent receptor.